ncbi:MAG: DUF2071 domain-containing protein [Gemmataceae bacterium]
MGRASERKLANCAGKRCNRRAAAASGTRLATGRGRGIRRDRPPGRPQPPAGPATVAPDWGGLLFLHWPVPAERLRPLVPPPLELDTHGGMACVGGTRLPAPAELPLVHAQAEPLAVEIWRPHAV